jgi:hypothetical protein
MYGNGSVVVVRVIQNLAARINIPVGELGEKILGQFEILDI